MYFKLSKFFLYLVPFTIIFVNAGTLFPFIVTKYVWFRTSVDLALIFFLLGLLFQSRDIRSPKIGGQYWGDRMSQILKSPLVIAVTVFTAIFLLASLFAFDPGMAFWSNFERGEGGLQMLHLWLFFLLAIALFREEKDWRKLFGFSLAAGVLMALYGLAAGLGRSGFVGPAFNTPSYRFQGSIGNPAYVAAYVIFLIFYALYLLNYQHQSAAYQHKSAGHQHQSVNRKHQSAKISINQHLKGKILLSALIIIFLIVFWAAATRGGFIGLLAAIFAFAVYFIFVHKKWRKWLILGTIILLLVIGLIVSFRDTPFVKSLPGSRLFDLTFTTQTFQDRTIMWGIALKGWQARPLLGWGPENYSQVFDRYFDTRYFNPAQGFGAWFDRAHSIYFDYLVETGILGLLSYLSIFVVFYWQLLYQARINADKDADKRQYISVNQHSNQPQSALQRALLFALPIAYLVQGLVLFDVLPIYINLFLFLAFAVYKFQISSTSN